MPILNQMYMFRLCSASDLCANISFYFPGVGRTAPDPSAEVTLDGVQVPLGKGANTNIDDTSLLYNEYPLIFIFWFMIWKLILPRGSTSFLLCHTIDYFRTYNKNFVHSEKSSFLTKCHLKKNIYISSNKC